MGNKKEGLSNKGRRKLGLIVSFLLQPVQSLQMQLPKVAHIVPDLLKSYIIKFKMAITGCQIFSKGFMS